MAEEKKFLGKGPDFWRAIQGMGEGFAGRGPQWQAAQARQREAEAYAQKQEDAKRQEQLNSSRGNFWERVQYGNALLANGDQRGRDYLLETLSQAEELGVENLPQGVTGSQIAEIMSKAPDEAFAREAQSLLNVGVTRGKIKPQGEDGPKTSAMTRVLADGSILQTDNRQGTRLIGPDGQEVTDPAARAAAIREAQEIEREQARALYASRAEGTATGKGQGNRLQEVIDVGLRASQQMPILNRNMELLKELNTGGFSGAGMKIRNALGIQGADEAELTTNMARSVLSQLRDTFGAAFTEREGARLERIEAGIGNSTEANKRIIEQLLKMAEFKAGRAISLAKEQGDYYTVQEIEANMNMNMGEEAPQVPQIKIRSIRPAR